MTDQATAPAAPTDVYSMTPEQAGAALAEKTAAYKVAQAPIGSVAPPPGAPATTPGQAAARLAALKSDPAWRDKLLAGAPQYVKEYQELSTQAVAGDLLPDTGIETIDAVSDPSALRKSHYEGLIAGLRDGGMNETAENYIRALDADPNLPRGTEGDKLAFKAFRDRLMRSPDLREKYLNGSSPKLTSLMNALNRVIALTPEDGRPISAEGRELLAELEKL